MEKHIPNIPKEVRERGRHVRLLFLGFPMFLITSYMLYRRVIVGDEKRVRTGEILQDGSIRPFSPEEIRQHDQNSIMTKIFGDESKVGEVRKR